MTRKKSKQLNIGIRLAIGAVFCYLTFFLITKELGAGANAINANANGITKITRDCADYAATHSLDVSEKNQIFGQCTKEKMANAEKKTER